MKLLKTLTVVTALGFVLSAAVVHAQTAPPAQPPATQPPATQPPATQPPATQKPDPASQKPAEPKPQPKPPAPFPEGAKVAVIDFQYIASTSEEGKVATTRIQALQKKKNDELAEKNKALQAQQQKLQTSGNLMNDTARNQLEREIEKAQRDLQFAQEDATAEVRALTEQLQQEFGEKLGPIVEAIAKEKGLHVVLQPQAIVWAQDGLNISEDVVKRLNAGAKPPPKK